jgi:cyclic dehypoxanthinyl futalosine synthase
LSFGRVSGLPVKLRVFAGTNCARLPPAARSVWYLEIVRWVRDMISCQEALDLFQSGDLIGIGMEADAVRRKWHPEGIVSYIIDRNINYTNFCTEYCSFCAFYRPMGHAEGYVLPKETIYAKIQETIDLGGTGVLMQGGLHPDLKIEWYEDLFRGIKQRFRIHLHCLSAPEVTNIAQVSGLSLRDTIARLRDSGLDSIPGGGAEILDDAVRHRISRLKCSVDEWTDVHRTAHQLGMRTTATMMFGCGETLDQRIRHLNLVRNLQAETGGFTAFIPWTFQRENTSLGRFVKEEATAVEYLQTLAISRIFLDNIENVQSSWVTQGLKTCQLGLRFGGNDVGSIMIEENVVSAAGAHHRASEEELRRLIRDAGFIPKQRDTLYRTYFLN